MNLVDLAREKLYLDTLTCEGIIEHMDWDLQTHMILMQNFIEEHHLESVFRAYLIRKAIEEKRND